MDSSHRDFLRTSSSAAASVALAGYLLPLERLAAQATPPHSGSVGDPHFRELTQVALEAARSAGASYADIRISVRRRQYLGTRERQVQEVGGEESFGFGVRALAGGAWGSPPAASSPATRLPA